MEGEGNNPYTMLTKNLMYSFKLPLRGLERNKRSNYEDLLDPLTVGSSTSALRYTRIRPISLPSVVSTDPPRRTGANSRKINEINPRIM